MIHPFHHRTLPEILVERGFLRQDDLNGRDATKAGFVEALLQDNLLTPEQFAAVLAEQLRLPFTNLEGFTASPELFSSISAERAYEYGVLPYRREGKVLHVVVSDPTDIALAERPAAARIPGL